jgi:hypothetical protein
MKVNFDFTNVDSFETIPQGKYTCYLFDVDEKTTRKGDPMYVLILKIAEGEHKGRQLFYNLPVMRQTMWKIKESIEAFGLELPKGPISIDFDDLLGKKVKAIVTHREWEGKTRENVAGLERFTGTNAELTDFGYKNDEVPF